MRRRSSSPKKLTVAQIGCGAFAEGQDFPNFKKNPHVELKWCCDVSADRARAMAEKFGVPNVSTDYREIMNDPEVGLVKIATSHDVHLPIVAAAAQTGKHVFCEKPLAMDEDDALEIVRAVRRSGIKLCVDLNRRMSPSMVALRRHWQEHCAHPKHQPWRYVETERDLFPEEAQTQFLTRVQDESYSYKLVHLDPLRGGGLILGESVHWLDLACWFFSPQAPTEIRTWGSTRFSHGIHLTFSAGDTATILFHCGGTFDYPKELIEVASHGALFRNRFFVENAYYGIPGLERERFPLQRDSFRHVGREGGFDGYMKKYAARVKACRRSSKATINELVVDKGHENMLNVFVDAVLHDRPSPCGEMDGYLATYLARMACRSIELRQALPIPIDKLTPCLV